MGDEVFHVGDKVYFIADPDVTRGGVVHPLEKEYFITKIERGLAFLGLVPNGFALLVVPLERITHQKIPTNLWEHLEDQGDA